MRVGRRGVTLIELMVVMSIIAILLGFGMAFMTESNKDKGLRATKSSVLGICRFARTSARNSRAPVAVKIDPEGRWIATVVRRPMGAWSLEDTAARGSYSPAITLSKSVIADDGRIGKCVAFDDSGGNIDCGALPLYAPDQGLLVEMWYRAKKHGRNRVLAEKRDEFVLTLDKSGSLAARVGDVELAAKGAYLPEGRWIRISLICDGKFLTLAINGNPIVRKAGKVEFTQNSNPLTLGTKENGLDGWIDEVRVDALVEDSRYNLPEGLAVSASGNIPEVHFDATGALDTDYHQAPVTLTIKNATGSSDVTINMLGGSQ